MIYGVANPSSDQPIKGSLIDVYARLWEGDITGTNTVKQLNTLYNSPFMLEDTKILWNRFTNKIAGFIGGIDKTLLISKILSPIILIAVIVLYILIVKDIIKTNSWKLKWQFIISIGGLISAVILLFIGYWKSSTFILICNAATAVACIVWLCYCFYNKGKEDNNTPAETPTDPDNNGDKPPENPDDNNGDAGTPPETPTDPNGDDNKQ